MAQQLELGVVTGGEHIERVVAIRAPTGVGAPQILGDADRVLKQMADDQGVGGSFYRTDVAVYFGKQGGPRSDPYFGGEGPGRLPCVVWRGTRSTPTN